MKIQMLECISGPLGTFRVGEIWDNPDAADANRIIAAGFAICVDSLTEEKAVEVETPEAKLAAKRSKR
jgi:hypothetical protein